MAKVRGKYNCFNIVLLSVCLLFVTGCNGGADISPVHGAATDALTNNLMNDGFIVSYGDKTFFRFRSGDLAVYNIDEQGQIAKVLDDIQASQLLVNDQWVYIIDHAHYPDSSFGIYRFEPDNMLIQVVHQDKRQQKFAVYCDAHWIYYCVNKIVTCHTDEPPLGEEPRTYDYYTLYKMNHAGDDIQQVLDYTHYLNKPYISDGWIYYAYDPPEWAIEQENLVDRESGLYKIRLDGTGKTKLLDEIPFSPIVKQGNWLIYSLDGIYLLDIDGSERVKLCDDHAARLNTKDDWIYYTCFDDNISLYRIDCDGNNRQKMSAQERVQDVAISGDWVYFHVDQGSTWPLYRIKTDGTVEERIELGRGVVPVETSQIQR